MLDKYFVPYDRALKLKELGFDEECFAHYTSYGYYNENKELKWKRPSFTLCNGVIITNDSLTWQEDQNIIIKQVIAPLFCQAFDWFREKYNLISSVHPYHELTYSEWFYNFSIVEYTKDTIYGESRKLNYQEAQLACLDKLIEICSSVS